MLIKFNEGIVQIPLPPPNKKKWALGSQNYHRNFVKFPKMARIKWTHRYYQILIKMIDIIEYTSVLKF